jgi:(S)-ureidoglycine aminohydrolase
VFVLDGAAHVRIGDHTERIEPNGFAFMPAGADAAIAADGPCRLHVFETRYVPHPDHEGPEPVFGDLGSSPSEPFMGDDRVRVRRLLPDLPSFDLAVNVMQFDPGAALPLVETHANEHGLFMLAGGGIYRLEDAWYPVQAGDAIWMGPYCPQWFGALGAEESGYLLYKDQNRDWLTAAAAR